MSKKYGPEHREAREKKLASLSRPACEVTGETKNLEAHHNVLKLFDGPDDMFNYTILSSAFHQMMHDQCNVQNGDLVGERLKLANYLKKHILDEAKVRAAKLQLDLVDEQLIGGYIQNFIEKIAHTYQNILFLTLYSNFKTISNQQLEIHRLKTILAQHEPSQ